MEADNQSHVAYGQFSFPGRCYWETDFPRRTEESPELSVAETQMELQVPENNAPSFHSLPLKSENFLCEPSPTLLRLHPLWGWESVGSSFDSSIQYICAARFFKYGN